ncbi:MAG TPA: glycosyltransferase family 4 protein [Thermoanaerobaculia bacterium]|nr:glycosyltransferase family 4 protein [Thermoanaerobaculia bacterium]
MLRVVVHTPDVVGERMAGPGIRAWHFADELSKHFDVTLIARLEGKPPEAAQFSLVAKGSAEAKRALHDADVLLGQPARGFRRQRKAQRIIYDLFDPVLLELREMYGRSPSIRQRVHLAAETSRVKNALKDGDLLIVATQKQLELYKKRDALVIPFGAEKPHESRELRAESLVLWGGGTWEWLDPKTAVEATIKLNRAGVPCRLLFLGRTRPNRDMVDRRREDRFDRLVASGYPFVQANEEWIPYRDRLSWLHRAKIAIMLHRPTAEAAYSIRTRLFDAIAATVPVITTEEGFAAELVRTEGLGVVVPPDDVDAVAAAMRKLLCDDAFHARCVQSLARIRPRYAWDVVTQPLIDAIQRWKQDD